MQIHMSLFYFHSGRSEIFMQPELLKHAERYVARSESRSVSLRSPDGEANVAAADDEAENDELDEEPAPTSRLPILLPSILTATVFGRHLRVSVC